MANALYPEWKDAIMTGATNSDIDAGGATNGLHAALVDTDTYTYSDAHEFYSSVTGVIADDVEVANITLTAGVVDGDNITWPSVPGPTTGEAIVLYRKNAGANTTWRLVAYIDTGVTGLPVTPNGGNIDVSWNASGIFSL